MKRFFAFLFCGLLGLVNAHSQNADTLTRIIEADKVTFSQVEYLCAVESGIADENATEIEAMELLEKQYFKKVKHNADKAINLSQTADILARTWNVNRSIIYSEIKLPRYAFKMLQAEGIIGENADPHKKLSGHEFLNMFSACLEKYGERK